MARSPRARLLLLVVLALLSAALLQAAYSYYYSDTFSTIDTSKWIQNGTLTAGANGLTGGWGWLYSTVAVPDGSSEYEVKGRLRLTSALNVEYALVLRTDTTLNNHYAVEYKPTYNSGGVCNGTLRISRSLNGSWSVMASTSYSCHDNMEIRGIMKGSTLSVFVDGVYAMQWTDAAIATGKPGVSLDANTGLYRVDLGPLDRVAPSAVNSSTITYTAQAARVDAAWTAAADDANGAGIWKYEVLRNGVFLFNVTTPAFADLTVSPATLYTYSLIPHDFHNNEAPATTFNVLTPGAAVTHTITSAPTGRTLTVDGASCTSPCSFQWTPASSHTIATTQTQAGAAGTQYQFSSWSDAGAISHTITASSTPATYTA
ncbi:MAG: hypothetical protein HY858_16485, partial [Candidatus Solibacter usitatus]|nr:hypothetical protein [Candidatus Solibacter usitatus]